MGPRAGLDRRKISSPPGFDPGPSSQYSVAIPTELPGPNLYYVLFLYNNVMYSMSSQSHATVNIFFLFLSQPVDDYIPTETCS